MSNIHNTASSSYTFPPGDRSPSRSSSPVTTRRRQLSDDTEPLNPEVWSDMPSEIFNNIVERCGAVSLFLDKKRFNKNFEKVALDKLILLRLRRNSLSYKKIQSLASNSLITPAIITELLTFDTSIMEVLAGNKAISSCPDAIKILAELNNDEIHWRLAENPAISSCSDAIERLETLAQDNDEYKIYQRLPLNPAIASSLETVKKLANSDSETRALLARNTALASFPKDIIEKLLNDPEEDVRKALAGNPKITEQIMETLLNAPEEGVRKALAGNPKITERIMEKLLSDPEKDVRKALAGNPKITEQIIETLLNDPEEGVRKALAGNPKITERIMEKLLIDPEKDVRKALAGNPKITEQIIEKLLSDIEQEVIRKLSENRNISKEFADIAKKVLATLHLLDSNLRNPIAPHLRG